VHVHPNTRTIRQRGANTYVEESSLVGALASHSSGIIDGRRGTGKTHALKYLAETDIGSIPRDTTRIVEAAAELIYTHGVKGTTNEQVRTVAGVSGSQLNQYFPDKESLIRAVIAWRTDRIIALHQIPALGRLDTFEALHL
jgi:AcrR family transcriptional regulator